MNNPANLTADPSIIYGRELYCEVYAVCVDLDAENKTITTGNVLRRIIERHGLKLSPNKRLLTRSRISRTLTAYTFNKRLKLTKQINEKNIHINIYTLVK